MVQILIAFHFLHVTLLRLSTEGCINVGMRVGTSLGVHDVESFLSSPDELPSSFLLNPVNVVFEHKPERLIPFRNETSCEKLNAVVSIGENWEFAIYWDMLWEVREPYGSRGINKLIGILLLPLSEICITYR